MPGIANTVSAVFPRGDVRDRTSLPSETKISVCHLASGDSWGGAEAQVATLVRTLSRRRELNVCAVIFNQGRLADEVAASGIDVKVVPEKQHSFLSLVAEARNFIIGRNVRIFHSHRYKENLIAALLAFRNPAIRLVRTQHGRPETLAGAAGMKQRLVHSLDRITARLSADRVISVSGQLSNYIEGYVRREAIVTIPNGVDLTLTHCSFTRAEAKARLGIAEDEPVVGFAGRLEAVKRLDLFVAAAQKIAKQLPKVRFVIAGGGREEQHLRALISQYGIENRTHVLGHRHDMFEVLRAMDLLLITSDHEGLPMVLLEAMTLGTAIVARAVGGITEVIADGVSGLLVNDGTPTTLARVCLNALQNPSQRERLTRAAREVVENEYSSAHNASKVIGLYASLTEADWRVESAVAEVSK